jgi:5-methyltetrahydropteroyltriglutamate--homocysteine methyltransferase
MKILSKNHSSYPRVGDRADQQKLRRAYNLFDKRKLSAEELAKTIDDTAIEIIEEQLAAGCDMVTDGMVRSYDPVSHIARRIQGFEIMGLLRYFDTNFYYRQPKITGALEHKEPLVVNEFEFVRAIAGGRAGITLIGPYSLLKMSITDGRFEKALDDLADIYARELSGLKGRGASVVQLDEPALLHNISDFELVKDCYTKIVGAGEIPGILVALYFGNAKPLVDKLGQLPVDGICFDFAYSPGLEDTLADFPKDIGLGIIDGRNTKLENIAETITVVEKILNKLSSNNAYITSSCGLEFLPRDRAFDKLKLSAQIVGEIRGGKE